MQSNIQRLLIKYYLHFYPITLYNKNIHYRYGQRFTTISRGYARFYFYGRNNRYIVGTNFYGANVNADYAGILIFK